MTLDEGANLRRCLESVEWSNDVVVLDSGSRDATVAIARQFANVRVITNRFENYSAQRNHGLSAVSYRNQWVLLLDADEIVDKPLREELLGVARLGNKNNHHAYALRRHTVVAGQRLTFNLSSRFWIGRLVRPGSVFFEGLVHERLRVEGRMGRLRGYLEHHQFAKGLDDWLIRRARYARLGAEEAASAGAHQIAFATLFDANPLVRRTALKTIAYRLPFLWLVYALYNLLFCAAFLDGRRGLSFVGLEAYAHYLAQRQLRRGDRLPVAHDGAAFQRKVFSSPMLSRVARLFEADGQAMRDGSVANLEQRTDGTDERPFSSECPRAIRPAAQAR